MSYRGILRVLGTILWYVAYFAVFHQLTLWVLGTTEIPVDARFAVIGVAVVPTLVFIAFSEVHEKRQGIREDVLDLILGDSDAY